MLIEKLKETKNTAGKAILKRLLELNKKGKFTKEDLEELDIINNKLYSLLLDLFTEETKSEIVICDAIVKVKAHRIHENSSWIMSKDHNFHHGSNSTVRDKYGYDSKNHRSIEYAFIKDNLEDLQDMHRSLIEKETILNGEYDLKDENDRELAKLLITYLGYNKGVKESVKRVH